jgi:hypothetical protein
MMTAIIEVRRNDDGQLAAMWRAAWRLTLDEARRLWRKFCEEHGVDSEAFTVSVSGVSDVDTDL